MSREEVAAFLRNLQLSLDGLQRELEASIKALPDTKRDQLPQVLAGCRRRVARFDAEQLAEFDSFAAEAGLQVDEHAGGASSDAEAQSPASAGLAAGGDGGQFEGTPYAHGAAQLCSLERRVASMGGIPALGACVLPRMTPGMRPQLTVTASPAAVEIMRGRLGGSDADATPLRKTGGSGGEAEAAATPLVQLRATPAGRPADTPGGAAPADSELAAAIQRRMQRLGSSSPEKDAAAASPPGTVAG